MDCRSCGIENAPDRRFCRECGSRLQWPCPSCAFPNAVDDKHCGGCGIRLATVAGSPGASATLSAPAPGGGEGWMNQPFPAGVRLGGSGVTTSEIDGLFENILAEESEEREEGGA